MHSPSHMWRTILALASWLPLFTETLPAAEPAPNESAANEFFERSVRPVLAQHCFSCHGREKKKGGLSLTSRAEMLAGGESGAVVELGKPKDSLLIEAVGYEGDTRMPPNGRLGDAEIAALRKWVELGAPWPESATKEAGGIRASGTITDDDRQFWSFRPVKNPEPPAVKETAWPRRSIDHFVLAQLEANGLKPVGEADRRTLIRRATFDLVGLPPTPEEVETFVADESSDAYERLVDRLLASRHYGERWARHWLDVARYGEDQAHTFQARMYPNGYRYRDWVVEAFNRDLPYNQFVIEQIAGDLLPDGDRIARLPALGYFALGPVYYADAGCANRAIADELDDRVDTLTRGFLGLTVSCARCHDHKFDPITMHDYYALAGVFASSQYQEAPLVAADVAKQYDDRAAVVKQHEKKQTDAQADEARKLGESFGSHTAKYIVAAWKLQNRRQQDAKADVAKVSQELGLHEFLVERWMKFLTPDLIAQKPYLSELNRTIQGQDPKQDLSEDAAAVEAIERAAAATQERLVVALRTRDELDADYARKVAEAVEAEKDKVAKPKLEPALVELIKELLTDRNAPLAVPKERVDKLLPDDRKSFLADLQKELDRLKQEVGPKYATSHSLKEGSPTNLKLHLRGNHKDLGDEVPRRFLTVLSPAEPAAFGDGSGRTELAKAIASPGNPLTARVLVNRVWQYHFGRGIVGTPSNFGMLGERPSHPELLDHLAARFVASGWSIKQLHREIMLSATYRLSSAIDARNQEVDPDNRLLWRANRRRLDIESWRDSLLAVSGNLDLTVSGPAVNLNDTNNRRRTLYAAVSRHDLNGMLRLFDFPDPNLTTEKRVVTLVPMQQLFVLNSDFMIRQAKSLVARIGNDKLPDDYARINQAYRLLVQRAPTEAETRLGLTFLGAPLPNGVAAADVKLTAWEQYAQALLGMNEFLFVD
ncbi:MAG: DUF1553 domain-containing protein [Planctomycetales bacterium]|nr:DUF1553 domain-containing protein [Planctomycetales bacterium]